MLTKVNRRSPYTTFPLTDGSHTLSVRAKDAAGNTDPTPASRSFKIDTTAPNLAISARRAKMTRHGVAEVKLTCPAREISGPCEGTLKLKAAKRVMVGHRRRKKVTPDSTDFSIPAGEAKEVKVHLSKRDERVIKALNATHKGGTASPEGMGRYSWGRERSAAINEASSANEVVAIVSPGGLAQ